jgi:hypothetical protein
VLLLLLLLLELEEELEERLGSTGVEDTKLPVETKLAKD